jgi:uncharacterized repeat protein (TIGR03803 family)
MRLARILRDRGVSYWLAAALVLLAGIPDDGAAAGKLRTLHSFCASTGCADGQWPFTRLLRDPLGNLYGTTSFGGDQGEGVVFELVWNAAKDQWKFRRLYSFCAQANCADGAKPHSGLIIDRAGNLYGTTTAGGSGGGIAFELSPHRGTWTLGVLYDFCPYAECSDGNYPNGGLTYAAAPMPYDGVSPLYGVTTYGGAGQLGTAFQLTPVEGQSRWQEKILYSFCTSPPCNDEQNPTCDLSIDSAGNLYGTTIFGGPANVGIVFELAPDSGMNNWSETVLYNFCSASDCRDGRYPTHGVTLDGKGNLFGIAGGGGHNNNGVAFELTSNGWPAQFRVLNKFCSRRRCIDGSNPSSGLSIDDAGDLFGLTESGGKHDDGMLYKLNGSFADLHNFCAKAHCVDGEQPTGGLTMSANGDLFGVAFSGGAYGGGAVFEWSP